MSTKRETPGWQIAASFVAASVVGAAGEMFEIWFAATGIMMVAMIVMVAAGWPHR